MVKNLDQNNNGIDISYFSNRLSPIKPRNDGKDVKEVNNLTKLETLGIETLNFNEELLHSKNFLLNHEMTDSLILQLNKGCNYIY